MYHGAYIFECKEVLSLDEGQGLYRCMDAHNFNDYVDRNNANFSSTETKTNQESTKLICVRSYPTVQSYPMLPIDDRTINAVYLDHRLACTRNLINYLLMNCLPGCLSMFMIRSSIGSCGVGV